MKRWNCSDKQNPVEFDNGFMINIINVDGDFGFLLVSKRYIGTQFGNHQKSYDKDKKVMTKVLKDNPLPYFYWTHKPLRQTEFSFINSQT